ncbi:hypothetical protein GCM10012290_01950 [Halolactibacillus alkaliphilus]|uniref:Chloride channel protein n=1 Tax=Halolactibacillus alkaliphilus TaxID=442899 RepID=A0A511X0G1_9BACI|nr:chloride channel protein [Halolactibacillus alkaliphilus]GEN56437.1 hypothetical protein HAL01_09010 [Halolactibacillus alkaliphilus]GGN64442.1 hypothetical protein GCM10012290_01950 [Halolactibacillus alkaliphilus]SFO61091.1 chloride channel protein, CIC family [Halolactibacillus alkaliphilus]
MLRYVNIYMLKWLFFATLVGIGGGISAIILNESIALVGQVSSTIPIWLGPIIGGGLVVLIAKVDEEVFGSGSPKYIDAVNLDNGEVKRRTWLSKLVASASTIGFNGSGGVEGPMLLMGSSFANLITKIKFLRKWTTDDDRRILSIAGAAGAIGAIFRSPLGGGIFAAEILYKSSLHYSDIFPAVLSSTVGFIVYSTFGTADPMFIMTDYQTNPRNIIYYVLAGLLAGYMTIIFTNIFHKIETYTDWLNKKGLGTYLPIIGGLLTGVVLLFVPEAAGTGTRFIQQLIHQPLTISFLLILVVGKIFATSFTVAFRGSAGLVIPALFIGAVSGGIISSLFGFGTNGIHSALITAGMSGALASVANVPIAATILIIEMVGYHVGGAAVIGSVVGFLVGHHRMIYINFKPDDKGFNQAKEFRKLDRYFEGVTEESND